MNRRSREGAQRAPCVPLSLSRGGRPGLKARPGGLGRCRARRSSAARSAAVFILFRTSNIHDRRVGAAGVARSRFNSSVSRRLAGWRGARASLTSHSGVYRGLPLLYQYRAQYFNRVRARVRASGLQYGINTHLYPRGRSLTARRLIWWYVGRASLGNIHVRGGPPPARAFGAGG